MSSRTTRGFTLIELAIGIALGLVVVGAITGVLAATMQQNGRQRAMSELSRDAQFASQLLVQDLRQAGIGVPTGAHVQQECDAGGTACVVPYGTAPRPARFLARRVLVAGTQALGILGDLPRVDSNYNAFGPLHNRVTGLDRNTIAWHTENNGTCVPNAAADCDTRVASLFFPAAGGNACSAANPNVRTCPWGLARVVANERIQIVDGGGNWAHAAVDDPVAVIADAAHKNIVGLSLSLPFDLGAPSLNNDVNDAVWINDQPGDGPAGIVGQGFVTTLDRVFYRLQSGRLTRTQCSGDPDPSNARWPPASSNTVPGTLTYLPPATDGAASEATVCVGPEVVARNVLDIRFDYFDASGTAITTFTSEAEKNNIRRIAWRMVLRKSFQGATKQVDVVHTGSVHLQN
jgi:hypothetical protein